MENPLEIKDSLGKRRYDVLDKSKKEAMRNFLPTWNKDLLIPSPIDDEKAIRAQQCVQESVIAGSKAGAIAFVASAVPTFVAVKKCPWAKAYIKAPQQALIIACATATTFYFTADKTLVQCARKNAHYHKPS